MKEKEGNKNEKGKFMAWKSKGKQG